MTVKFDILAEFLVEMERDAVDGTIADGIVRRTTNRLLNEALVPLFSTVVGYYSHGHLVTCQIERGQVWEEDASEEAQPVLAQLAVDRRAIAEFCAQHALDLRGGRFQ